MLSEPTIIGIYVGIALSLLFLAIHVQKRRPPKLNQVVLILLGAVGWVLGLDFGYIVLTAEAEVFGAFKDHRITMLLGALAVVWTSCESLVEIYASAFKSERPSSQAVEAPNPQPEPDGTAGAAPRV